MEQRIQFPGKISDTLERGENAKRSHDRTGELLKLTKNISERSRVTMDCVRSTELLREDQDIGAEASDCISSIDKYITGMRLLNDLITVASATKFVNED
jgi:hypothetical protein